MANAGQASAGSRGPVRAAVLSLVTVSLCGFWCWGHVNRQLRALGRPADPGRALTAVTVGWLSVVPPFRSVHRTAMIAEAEPAGRGGHRCRGGGQGQSPGSLRRWLGFGGFLIGVLWLLIAMVFVGCVQRELNWAIGQPVPAGT